MLLAAFEDEERTKFAASAQEMTKGLFTPNNGMAVVLRELSQMANVLAQLSLHESPDGMQIVTSYNMLSTYGAAFDKLSSQFTKLKQTYDLLAHSMTLNLNVKQIQNDINSLQSMIANSDKVTNVVKSSFLDSFFTLI
ncbi:hypothetical protein Ciccas_004846 [Cichlidogyrus casuarinus]|uniref:Uncharacterized protein n=1 Tax=Cichlidogyrus casuarinus TaxID=1844966 RepID=A0ABD2QB96_9PLAT